MNENELKKIAEGLIETTDAAGKISIDLYKKGLKKIIKSDNSPVTNGDLEVNRILTDKIKELTPNIPIVSEETVDFKKKNNFKTFWLIDPIDGTKEYIAGKDEYTINAALVLNQIPTIGLLGAPKKNRLFYAFGKNNSYMIENDKTTKLSCSKKTEKGKIFAVSGSSEPGTLIKSRFTRFSVSPSAYRMSKVPSLFTFVILPLIINVGISIVLIGMIKF